ncbi:MAG: methylated-DNA--[protein]-cysteine S-methyltransferase [Chloroflexi bacterium]|nr:methylated-DNA--[protein]-cysteine S-methyltransferase [Chloroflexota bacterium]
MEPTHVVWIPSSLGAVRLDWAETERGPQVWRIALPRPAGAPPQGPAKAPARLQPLLEGLQRFLQGQAVDFDLGLLAMERCSPFQRRVLLAEYAIPRGWVSSYGRIAAHLGQPNAARAVGTALARNPFPLVIPCHRAVRNDGRLGGFQGGLPMKQALLAQEGVAVSPTGVVLAPRWMYE